MNNLNELIQNAKNKDVETLKRILGKVEKYVVQTQQAVVSLPTLHDSTISVPNKSGDYVSVGDYVWIYYWSQINSGYIAVRVNDEPNEVVFSSNYVCNQMPYEASGETSTTALRANFVMGTVEITSDGKTGQVTAEIEPPEGFVFTAYTKIITTVRRRTSGGNVCPNVRQDGKTFSIVLEISRGQSVVPTGTYYVDWLAIQL